MTRPTYEPPAYQPDVPTWARRITAALAQLFQGKANVCLDVTLTANVGSTTLTDSRITAFSAITFSPTTSNAAAALATTYVSARGTGSATITHANAASTDRTFVIVIQG